MKNFLNLSVYSVKKFIIIYYAIGLIGLSIPLTAKYFIYITPFSILINLFFVLYFNINWNARFIIFGSLIFLLSMAAEITGVNTGVIFGSYTYDNSVLGPKLLGTPVIIGINWIILIYCTVILVDKFRIPVIVKILAGGIIMLIFDIILEPVAGKLMMWNWLNGEVPLQNYAAWFIMSCLFIGIMYLGKTDIKNTVSAHLLLVLFIFFAGLNLFL
ncbi:MAG: carotenoid biosynthesis protein [Bacteroidales bacterium]|nr:MAG: carotenoid biosynthesis protein [Bacteroidales bacterium]